LIGNDIRQMMHEKLALWPIRDAVDIDIAERSKK